MEIINSPELPQGNGHYSHAIKHNGLLFISGQLPIDPVTMAIPEGIAAQTSICLQKIESILTAAGSNRSDVLQVRIYVSDIELWDAVNERYGHFFGTHKPARCVVPTKALHFGSLIEIEAVAACN